MSFDGTEGSSISYSTAHDMCEDYQQNKTSAVKAFYLGRDLIEEILDQSGCVGIRVYKGLDSNGDENFIWVGVDSSENDMTGGVIADQSLPCPNYCGQNNDLNNN